MHQAPFGVDGESRRIHSLVVYLNGLCRVQIPGFCFVRHWLKPVDTLRLRDFGGVHSWRNAAALGMAMLVSE